MLNLAFGKAFSIINAFIFILASSNVCPETFTSPTEGINKSPVGVIFVGRVRFSPIIMPSISGISGGGVLIVYLEISVIMGS